MRSIVRTLLLLAAIEGLFSGPHSHARDGGVLNGLMSRCARLLRLSSPAPIPPSAVQASTPVLPVPDIPAVPLSRELKQKIAGIFKVGVEDLFPENSRLYFNLDNYGEANLLRRHFSPGNLKYFEFLGLVIERAGPAQWQSILSAREKSPWYEVAQQFKRFSYDFSFSIGSPFWLEVVLQKDKYADPFFELRGSPEQLLGFARNSPEKLRFFRRAKQVAYHQHFLHTIPQEWSLYASKAQLVNDPVYITLTNRPHCQSVKDFFRAEADLLAFAYKVKSLGISADELWETILTFGEYAGVEVILQEIAKNPPSQVRVRVLERCELSRETDRYRFLKFNGMDEVTLWRGARWSEASIRKFLKADWNDIGDTETGGNRSFTLDLAVALQYASHVAEGFEWGRKHNIMLKVRTQPSRLEMSHGGSQVWEREYNFARSGPLRPQDVEALYILNEGKIFPLKMADYRQGKLDHIRKGLSEIGLSTREIEEILRAP